MITDENAKKIQKNTGPIIHPKDKSAYFAKSASLDKKGY
jgi:hypothetical protein